MCNDCASKSYFYSPLKIKKDAFPFGKASFELPSTGAFSNQFLEGMKQIYKFEPLLEVRLLRSGEYQVAVREEIAAMAV
jgi:hypothetical protein